MHAVSVYPVRRAPRQQRFTVLPASLYGSAAVLAAVLQMQKDYLDGEIRKLSNSHVVHPGIQRSLMPLHHARKKQIAVPINPKDIPGVTEAGWTPQGKPG